MGLDYSFHIGIGFVISYEDVVKAVKRFSKKTTEVFHMEDRYDPKTGEKLELEKVVDVESDSYYEFHNIKFHNQSEFLEYFFDFHEINYSPDLENKNVYLTIKLEHTGEDTVGCGRVSVGESVLYANAISKESQSSVMKIKDFITKELRFIPPEPKIFIESYIG